MKILNNMKYLVRLSQWCTIVPFYSKRENENGYRVPKTGTIYAYVMLMLILCSSCWLTFLVLFHGSQYRIIKSSHGDTEEINQTIETVFCILSYMMIVVTSVFKSKKHFESLCDIQEIDDQLHDLGFRGAYRCRLLSAFLTVVAVGVFTTAFYYIYFKSDLAPMKQIHLLIVYTLQLLYGTVFALYLRLLLMNLASRLAFVNERLSMYIEHLEKGSWLELRGLIDVFCKFRQVADNINSVTGVSLLCYIGFAFYTITNKSYLAFSTLTTHEPFRNKFDAMGLSLVWVVVEVLILIVVCNSCDAFVSEANTTAEILARVYGKSKEFQNIIDKFLTKSIKQEVQFTAYGFFVIDNSTLFKIFSAVTTYLVILIQFKQLEESKLEDYGNKE